MQKLTQIAVLILALATATSAKAATEIKIEALRIDEMKCKLPSSPDQNAGFAKFTITYNNSQSSTPTVFKLTVTGANGEIKTPQIQIPVAIPVYKDGILDLSPFMSGAMSGMLQLKVADACIGKQAMRESDLRMTLTPMK